MMTASETDIEDFENSKMTDDSAILEVSAMERTSSILKQENHDPDFMSSTSVDSSVIASASIDSFSTLPEQDMSDFGNDSRDLQVKVDSPQKHLETLETFITFRITTKTTRPEFEEGEYIVRRRYNDFIWLRQKLVDFYASYIIPPLPGKHTLLAQLDRYSKEFIIARMKLLHSFLNRVVNHPILSCDKDLKAFLTAKPAEFSILRKNRSNVLGKMSDSLQNITNNYSMKQRHLEFDRVKDYCNALSEKLVHIDKINCRIHKERQEYAAELHQLHPIFTQWSSSEPQLTSLLISIAKAVELNALAHQKLTQNVPNHEHEYIAYIESVKEALSRRDSMQIEYELTVDELAKRRLEKDQLIETPNNSNRSQNWGSSLWKGESRDEKLERLGQVIPRLAKRAEILYDRVECANQNLRSDIDRWSTEKQNDLKNMLITMADKQIQHYQDCTDSWEELLSGLKFDGILTDVKPPEKSIITT